MRRLSRRPDGESLLAAEAGGRCTERNDRRLRHPPPPGGGAHYPATTTGAARTGHGDRPVAVSGTSAPVDAIQAVLDESQRLYDQGKRDLDLGHIEQARNQFNRAIDVLLEAPYGARTEPRIREHFDRLVDRISAYEVKALADGDGFTEKNYEPASIDELLALSRPSRRAPSRRRRSTAAVQTDLAQTEHDIPIPLNQRVLGYIELFQGRLARLHRGGHEARQPVPADDSERLPRRRPAARSRLRAAGRERVQAERAVAREGQGRLAVHARRRRVENGLRHDWYIDERSDPEKATRRRGEVPEDAVARMFDGDWHLALASYNGGPGRVQRAMKRAGPHDFWKLAEKPQACCRARRASTCR